MGHSYSRLSFHKPTLTLLDPYCIIRGAQYVTVFGAYLPNIMPPVYIHINTGEVVVAKNGKVITNKHFNKKWRVHYQLWIPDCIIETVRTLHCKVSLSPTVSATNFLPLTFRAA